MPEFGAPLLHWSGSLVSILGPVGGSRGLRLSPAHLAGQESSCGWCAALKESFEDVKPAMLSQVAAELEAAQGVPRTQPPRTIRVATRVCAICERQGRIEESDAPVSSF